MRYTMTEHSMEEKAHMLDLITDIYIESYNSKAPVPKSFGSRAALVGYQILEMLFNNGVLTGEGIQGEEKRQEKSR